LEDNEIVQYFIVNYELNMSSGKAMAQVGHVARISTLRYQDTDIFKEWNSSDAPRIVILRGKEKDLLKLIEQDFVFIRDKGFTEVPPDSLTAVVLPPMRKIDAQVYIKRLQIYK
jgi:PTH2 family peptidyl-tRNA hydrolase